MIIITIIDNSDNDNSINDNDNNDFKNDIKK